MLGDDSSVSGPIFIGRHADISGDSDEAASRRYRHFDCGLFVLLFGGDSRRAVVKIQLNLSGNVQSWQYVKRCGEYQSCVPPCNFMM
jgi:hypothetical protein